MTQTRIKLAAEAVAAAIAERHKVAVVPYDAALMDHIQRMQTPSDSEEGRTMT